MLSPVAALEAMARPTIVFCSPLMLHVRAGIRRNTWFQSAASSFTPTPSRAAATFTATTLSVGTDHISVSCEGQHLDIGSARHASSWLCMLRTSAAEALT